MIGSTKLSESVVGFVFFLPISPKRCKRLDLRLLLLFCVSLPQPTPQRLLFCRQHSPIDKADTDGSARQWRNRIRHQRQGTRQRKRLKETGWDRMWWVCDGKKWRARERVRRRQTKDRGRQRMKTWAWASSSTSSVCMLLVMQMSLPLWLHLLSPGEGLVQTGALHKHCHSIQNYNSEKESEKKIRVNEENGNRIYMQECKSHNGKCFQNEMKQSTKSCEWWVFIM